MRLGQVIRKWRQVEDRTLEQTAKEIGIGITVLQRIETGGQGHGHSHGKPTGKSTGKVEMNGHTLAKILVWLFGDQEEVAGANR